MQDCSNVSCHIIHWEVLETTTNFTIKDNTTLVFKAKNCSTNFTVTIKDYKTLVWKAITFVVSMALHMLKMLDPDSTTNLKNVGPRPT